MFSFVCTLHGGRTWHAMSLSVAGCSYVQDNVYGTVAYIPKKPNLCVFVFFVPFPDIVTIHEVLDLLHGAC